MYQHRRAATKGRNLKLLFLAKHSHFKPLPRKGQVTCHRCQNQAFKFGFFKGYQRYRCRTCKKTFSDIPRRPLDDMRIEPEKAYQVIHMLCEGIGIRAIERLTQLNRRTVLGILETAGRKCAVLMDTKMRGIKAEQVGVDELFGFVKCKQYHCPQDDLERGDQYTWLAMERKTKLIINCMVMKRTVENSYVYMQDLKSRMEGRFQLSTDGWNGYTGYDGAVIQTFYNTIDYGFEVKHYGTGAEKGHRRYSPVKCQWSTRTAQVGNPDPKFINTSHVERCNLSFRLFNRRLTRLTLGYSKKIENLRHAMAMFVAFYNFCRKHSAHGKTPAMAHGLTDHVWTVAELLAVR